MFVNMFNWFRSYFKSSADSEIVVENIDLHELYKLCCTKNDELLFVERQEESLPKIDIVDLIKNEIIETFKQNLSNKLNDKYPTNTILIHYDYDTLVKKYNIRIINEELLPFVHRIVQKIDLELALFEDIEVKYNFSTIATSFHTNCEYYTFYINFWFNLNFCNFNSSKTDFPKINGEFEDVYHNRNVIIGNKTFHEVYEQIVRVDLI